MDDLHISIINTSNSRTAFGRYAGDLGRSMAGIADVLSFVVMKRDLGKSMPGRVYRGIYLPSLTSGSVLSNQMSSYLNLRFFGSVFRKGITDALGHSGTHPVVHYASQEVFPFHYDGTDVVTIHDLVALKESFGSGSYSSRQYRKLIVRNIEKYRKFERIVTVSGTVARELSREGFNGRISVIYPPVSGGFRQLGDKAGAKKQLGLPQDRKLVLSVSINHKRKNLETVRNTLDTLGSDFRLVRVGEKIGDSITFAGVDDEMLNMIYNACDVLLLPSLEEGFGYPVVESFAAGLPVVASDIEVFREVAGDAAVLVEPTPQGCAAGIREALSAGRELSKRGSQRAKLFGIDVFSQKVKEFYSALS